MERNGKKNFLETIAYFAAIDSRLLSIFAGLLFFFCFLSAGSDVGWRGEGEGGGGVC